MAKKIFLMMKKNSMTLLGAAILASWIFYVVNNPESFTASILSLQEQNFITKKWRDIAYKTNSGYVDIFIGENRQTPENIEFTISFDKDTVTVDPQNSSGQGTRTINSPDENSIIIESIPGENVDKSQSVFMLPFTGEQKDILLSEAVAEFKTNKKQDLSIGSLNEITTHSK